MRLAWLFKEKVLTGWQIDVRISLVFERCNKYVTFVIKMN